MKILSIHDGHNASAAVIENNEILSAVSEERLNRVKYFAGWPQKAIAMALGLAGISPKEIDVISVSHLGTFSYIKRKLSLKSTYTSGRPKIILGHLYHIYTVAKRELKIRWFAKQFARKKFFFCDHHLGHAASAYYCSGFDEALVVTIDGQGDGLSHTAWAAKSGDWQKVTQGGSEESLGAFYAAITEGLGFKPNRHEGKIVGLAAFSDGKLRNKLEPLVIASQDRMHFKRQGRKEMIGKVKQWKEQGYSREDIADYGQNLLEEMVIPYIRALAEKTGLKKLALAGGVFANVKLNQRIVEQCAVEEIFIQPAMGDEGIVLGSALHCYWQGQIRLGKKYQPNAFKNVYFGNGYTAAEAEALMKDVRNDYKVEEVENLEQRVARLVAEGKLVGWFDGRMEFGPRALGSRSILGDPRNKKINDILNERLRRSEFMPFAPSVLAEYANEIFENTEAAFHTAEFMAITFNVKPAWQEKIPAIVHVDGTCRPQLVKKEVNPRYWQVIDEFRKISGVPLVLNTSFNIHEEPIVATLYDGLRSLKQRAVDYVAMGRYLITNK